MEIVINPTAQRIWRTPTALQIGFGPKQTLLENLKPKHEILIDALYKGLTTEQVFVYAKHLKVRPNEAEALLKALEPVLLSNTSRSRQSSHSNKTDATEITHREYAEVASMDQQSLPFQAALGEMHQASRELLARGESVWLRRQRRAVFVDKIDQLGELMALGLARSGIGALIVGEQTEQRLQNLRNSLNLLPLRPQLLTLSQIKEPQISRIDLAILTGQQLIEPQKFAAWINRGVPALGAILASAAEMLEPFLGHIIVPAKTPCWVCLELARKAKNGHWPDMASQIVGRELRFDSSSKALQLAGLTIERGLAHIDTINGFENSSLEAAHQWGFSDDCSCRIGAS